MSLPVTLPSASTNVVLNHGRVAHLMDLLRDECALEMGVAFQGVSGKRIDAAGVPGCGRHGIIRAVHGSDTNPLFRLVAVFVLMKRLGMGRERALRVVDWLREVVEAIWPEEEPRDFGEVMKEEQQKDAEENRHQVDACLGIPGAAARMLEAARARRAYYPVMITALRARIAAEQGG